MHRRRRPEAHGGVQVIQSQPGSLAVGVGDTRSHADPVAHLEVADRCTDLGHGPRGLMAQDHGFLDDKGADGAMSVVVDIAAADAHSVDGDAHVVRVEGLGNLNRA